MTAAARRAGIAAAVAAGILAAGCGSAAPAPHATAAAQVPVAPLDTSLASAAGTWATVVMGGSAAQHNNFWQLFIRPAGSTAWRLITPPGTADNGGLVVAVAAGQTAITAFRPSQYLTYTPLSKTSDAGKTWAALGPLDSALASTPGSLSMQAGGSRVLALTAKGAAEEAAAGGGSWRTLATARTLATTPAGQRCGLRSLTAVAYTPAGLPMLAGACSHPGTAGIFAGQDGTWQPAGPAMPVGLAGEDATVLRLADTGGQTIALMQVGSGRTASLVVAWSAGNGSWTVSAPLQLKDATLAAASFGLGGSVAVILRGNRGETVAAGRTAWQSLPSLPSDTATLAMGPAGALDALSARGGRLTIWQLAPGSAAWSVSQTINVPIQYGSSG